MVYSQLVLKSAFPQVSLSPGQLVHNANLSLARTLCTNPKPGPNTNLNLNPNKLSWR